MAIKVSIAVTKPYWVAFYITYRYSPKIIVLTLSLNNYLCWNKMTYRGESIHYCPNDIMATISNQKSNYKIHRDTFPFPTRNL